MLRDEGFLYGVSREALAAAYVQFARMSATIRRLCRALGAFVAAIIIVCGVLYLPRHHFYLRGSAYSEFFERLPITLELIIASVIIALVLATVCTLLSRRPTAWLGAIVAALLFVFMCIPVFWLTLMGQLVFAVRGVHIFTYFVQLPAAGFAQYQTFDITDRFTHLVLPATLLALVQAGAYVDSMRSGTSAWKLFATFALLLPAILSADVLIEIFFAWPGVGRSFYRDFEPYHRSYMVAFLLLSAAAVIIVRTVASGVGRSEDTDAVEVFQPL